MKNRAPNILLIVLDSVRRDHLSCYGYARETTPNIDRLAEDGLLLERAYSTSCWTIPSHASLFTGQFPSQHQVDLDSQYLNPQTQTMASYLKQHGYRTACISTNNFVAGGVKNLNLGFDLTVDVEGGFFQGSSLPARLIRLGQKSLRRFLRHDRGARTATRLAREWIGQGDEPFFLFMNYMDCHLPYRLRRLERYRFVAPNERSRVDAISLDPFAVMAGALEWSEENIAGIQALYDGCLNYLDRQVGELVALLKRRGLFEDTLIIITSDHGESFGEHGLFDHQYGLYENLVRVPLVMHLPKGETAGLDREGLFQLADLFPALSHYLENAVQGVAKEGIFSGHHRQAVLAEYLVPNLRAFERRFSTADVSRFDHGLRAIISDNFKLICRRDGEKMLFDLRADPQELDNLVHILPDLAARLEERLFALLGPWPELGGGASVTGLTDELRERLEALGYL